MQDRRRRQARSDRVALRRAGAGPCGGGGQIVHRVEERTPRGAPRPAGGRRRPRDDALADERRADDSLLCAEIEDAVDGTARTVDLSWAAADGPRADALVDDLEEVVVRSVLREPVEVARAEHEVHVAGRIEEGRR